MSLFTKQILLEDIGIFGQRLIENARVVVVGCGGLGCVAVQYLVRSGFRDILVIDGDVVETSNLSRQILFSSQDIGKKKVDVAKLSVAEWAEIETIDKYLIKENLSLLDRYEIILDASDSFDTSLLLDEYVKSTKKTLIFAKVDRFLGEIAILDASSVRLDEVIIRRQASGCDAGVLPSMVGILGSMLVNELVKYLVSVQNSLYNQLLVMDLAANSFRKIRLGELVSVADASMIIDRLEEDTLLVNNRDASKGIYIRDFYDSLDKYRYHQGKIAVVCDSISVSSKVAAGLRKLLGRDDVFAVAKDILTDT